MKFEVLKKVNIEKELMIEHPGGIDRLTGECC